MKIFLVLIILCVVGCKPKVTIHERPQIPDYAMKDSLERWKNSDLYKEQQEEIINKEADDEKNDSTNNNDYSNNY